MSVHERIKRIELRHLYIWSTSAATWRIFLWLLVVLFQAFHVLLLFFMIFESLCACLGIKKVFMAYLILLGTWHMLESGPRYYNNSCLVRRLMTIVVGTTSFIFSRGDMRLSPLFLHDILTFDFHKIEYSFFRGWRRFSWLTFQRTFLVCFKYDLSGTSGIDLCEVPRMLNYTGYLDDRVIGGASVTELCGVPRIPS